MISVPFQSYHFFNIFLFCLLKNKGLNMFFTYKLIYQLFVLIPLIFLQLLVFQKNFITAFSPYFQVNSSVASMFLSEIFPKIL